MRAITIHQPYASLIAVGVKKYETRSWATSHRGPIAIHASKKLLAPSTHMGESKSILGVWKRMADIFGEPEPWRKPPLYVNSEFIALYRDQFPLGAVIATAELVACRQIACYDAHTPSCIVDHWGKLEYPSDDERLFGDWTPGRFAWELVKVQMLPEPIPTRGRQGLWDWRND